MTIDEACEAISYRGDACEPRAGEHDLKRLVAEAVSRLPQSVQEWLLEETTHVFIGGQGQLGEMFELCFPPREAKDELIYLRVIFLSEQLMRLARSDALWVVAHEIAHSWLRHPNGGLDRETEADGQAKTWGFIEPDTRAENLKRYPRV